MEQLTVIALLFGTLTLHAANGLVYEKVGDTVVLTPDSAVPGAAPIRSITWTRGADTAVDWFGGEPSYYRHFKGRSALNISTGALTITGLTRNDSGGYAAEINNRAASPTQLLVISPVSKPTVSTWCDPEMTHCVFTCEGNATGAEPVTYLWRMSDYVLTSTKVHNITKEETERSFKCMMENPVSYEGSDAVLNPFPRNQKWTLAYVILLLIAVAGVIVSLCVLFIKRKKGQAVDGTPPREFRSDFNRPAATSG